MKFKTRSNTNSRKGKLTKTKDSSLHNKTNTTNTIRKKVRTNQNVNTRLVERVRSELKNAKDLLKELGLTPIELIGDDILEEFVAPVPGKRRKKNFHVLGPPSTPISTPTVINTSTDTFPNIADEVMLNIFKWLPRSTLINCAKVCKQWNRIIYDETLWRRVDLGGRNILPGVMNHVLSRGVQVLRLAKSTFHSPVFTYNFESCRLRYLDLSVATIDVGSLEQLLNSCKLLKKLSLENCQVSEKICSSIGKNRQMTALNLALCEGLTKKGLCDILKGCSKLLDLNLAWTELDDQTLHCVADQLPVNLKRLNFSGFRDGLTNHVVRNIIERCKQIEEFDLSDSSLISREILKSFPELPNLHLLALSRCYSLRITDFYCLQFVPNLRNLIIFGMFQESCVQQLQLNLPNVLINQCLFSEIARPTTGNRCTSLWGIRVRA